MDDVDLAAIGALVELPEASSPRWASETPAGDRLGELAQWWARVAGTAPPKRVEQLWLSRPALTGRPQADVVIRRFDAPRDVRDALAYGVATADDAVDDGTDLLLLSVGGGPGGHDHAEGGHWPVLAAHLLVLDAVEAMGWPGPAGLSDVTWIARVAAIRDGLREVRGIRGEPERLLDRLGSPALAAGTGLLLQAAARRTPVLLDGPAAAACALLAHRVARASRQWLRPTDASGAVLHDRILTELRLEPLTRLGLGDEDGTASRIGLELLETAVRRAIDRADDDLEDEPDDEPDQVPDHDPGDEPLDG